MGTWYGDTDDDRPYRHDHKIKNPPARQELGVDVYELDGKTLCTELYEDKEILIPSLLGKGFHKMKVDAEHNAQNKHLYAVVQHWENLETVRKNYICTSLLDINGITRAKF